MAKRQEYTITAGVTSFTTTPVTVGGATSKETVKVTLIPADATLPHQVLTQGVDYDNDEYRVDGVADSVDSISIYWPSAADNVGATLRVEIYTDMTNPVASQLHDFNSAGANTPKMFDEQIQQMFSIFSQILGTGNSLGDMDLGDIVQGLTRINEVAALLFTTPTLDVDSNWDGTDTFTNYATVEAMDSALATLAAMVISTAGLPSVTNGNILYGSGGTWADTDPSTIELDTPKSFVAQNQSDVTIAAGTGATYFTQVTLTITAPSAGIKTYSAQSVMSVWASTIPVNITMESTLTIDAADVTAGCTIVPLQIAEQNLSPNVNRATLQQQATVVIPDGVTTCNVNLRFRKTASFDPTEVVLSRSGAITATRVVN